MIRTWIVTFSVLFSLLLSGYSAATMPVLMLTATQCDSNSMPHHSANNVSSMPDHHSSTSQSSLVNNNCHSINAQADNSIHHQSSMSDDCCNSACVVSYTCLPTPNAQFTQQSSLLLIEPYSSLLIPRPSNSLYRPPIA